MDRFHDTIPEITEPDADKPLIGHGAIIERLVTEAKRGALGHAYIFAGPKGIGKATAAFALARALLAAKGLSDMPSVSRQIAQGASPAVLHVTRRLDDKGKKFRTGILVDDIRGIVSQLALTAGDLPLRVIIVDPADDLNTAAANALLKNLEEPPEKTLFLLISHNPARLLPTIRSRCRLERFRPLDVPETTEVLEANRVAPDEARALAGMSRGSPRQALLLARYGGLDIIETLDSIFSGPRVDHRALQDFAGKLAERDREVHYQLLIGLIEDRLAEAARRYAASGALDAASRISEMRSDFLTAEREAAAYNLDRRVFLANELRRIGQALA